MRRANREIISLEQLREILAESIVCRVAFCQDNRPYLVPLNFGYHMEENGALTLYFHGANAGTKLELLKGNPQVAFEMERYAKIVPHQMACHFSCQFQSIVGTGLASLLEDFEEKKQALNLIMEHYTGQKEFSYPDQMVENLAVIQIKVESYTGKQNPIP